MGVTLITTLIALLCSNFVVCQVIYTIVPLAKEPCPVEPCLTLSQFAANSSKYLQPNTTLIFEQGDHYLGTRLKIENVNQFSLLSSNSTNSNDTLPIITCTNLLAKFGFENIKSVRVSHLVLRGCGGNNIQSVNSFELSDTIFQGQENHSGSALILNQTTITIVRSEFTSNNGSNTINWPDSWNQYTAGGAILANNSNVNVVGSKFQDNIAQRGGAIYSSHTILNIGSSYFYSCSGGAIYVESEEDESKWYQQSIISTPVQAVASRYDTKNMATGWSGSPSSSAVYITESNFSNNTEGAVTAMNLTISASNFYNNTGTAVITLGSLNLTTSNFTFNANKFSGQPTGGAVDAHGSMFISNCYFISNEAGEGGAIYYSSGNNHSEMSISACHFDENLADSGGAVKIETQGRFQIEASNFSRNGYNESFFPAQTDGGAVHVEGSWINANNTITASTFVNNAGGAILIEGQGFLRILECNFVKNLADSGGAICVNPYDGVVTMIIEDSNFTNNVGKTSDGGAIFEPGKEVRISTTTKYDIVNISGCRFVNNSAAKRGGVLFMEGTNLKSADNEFIGNSAKLGAVLYMFDGDIDVSDNLFTTNTAEQGIVYLYQNNATFTGTTTFQGNAGSLLVFAVKYGSLVIPSLKTTMCT